MANDEVKEATRELCRIIANDSKSPLRWTPSEKGNSIYILNYARIDGVAQVDRVCSVIVYTTSLKNSPVRAMYYVYFTGKYSSAAKEIQDPIGVYNQIKGISDAGGYKFILPEHVIDFVKDVVSRTENTKENNMSEFTLKTTLFGKLKENGINYKFIDGVYNPEKIVITTKMNHDICTVRSIPYSEDSDYAYEVRWTPVPTQILINLKIMSVKRYDTSDQLIKDILRVWKELRVLEKDFEPITMKWEVRTPVRPYGIVDVIFNDPATIIIWADGTKTVVKAENEKFDPEKGLAMAISKKVLGNKHNYYEVFKKYVGKYEKKQAKKANKEN